MAILIVCACGKLQRVPYSYEGKEVRCLYCKALIEVTIQEDSSEKKTEVDRAHAVRP